MKKIFFSIIFPALLGLCLLAMQGTPWAANQPADGIKREPYVAIAENAGGDVSRETDPFKQQVEQQTRTLFRRESLGFDEHTASYLFDRFKEMPFRLPELLQALIHQSRLLGVAGTTLMLIFIVALGYSIFGQQRVMQRIEERITIPEHSILRSIYPYVLSIIRIVIAALFPLVLLAAFFFINALIRSDAIWFRLVGQLLILWTVGSVFINLLREGLTRELFAISMSQGRSIYRPARWMVMYSILATGLYLAGAAFELRRDVLALLRFAVSLSIVVFFFLLLLKKNPLLSLLPDLPYPGYQKFLRIFSTYYIPLIIISLGAAFLWMLGYRTLGGMLLIKIWLSVGAYVTIMVVYNFLINALKRWYEHTNKEDEAASFLFRSFKSLLVYATAIAMALVILNLLGLMGWFKQIMSFAVFELGGTGVTLWVMLEAALVLLTFIFLSRFMQAYLDYRIYPAMGIEPGLGYAINTFIKYLMLAAGFLIALNVVGLDFRLLLVFAGAVGIGVGMGLQAMTANVISGFSLIFGGNLRKGDWIEVGGTMGVVTDILLRATMVRTRDNIDYLIPNTEFISGTLVNYTLSSPLIRIAVPVGVSYNANPQQVKKILLEVAAKERLVIKEKRTTVRFVEFGDSSINFELLIWIDVRHTPRRKVRSALYFAIFEALAKAGIEIPFPQRDIHVHGMVEKK